MSNQKVRGRVEIITTLHHITKNVWTQENINACNKSQLKIFMFNA